MRPLTRLLAASVGLAILCLPAAARARDGDLAISVAVGSRCHDLRTVDGGCLTAQTVALVGRYGEIHGSFLANYFANGGGVVVGAAWGGDLGSPFFQFARDRVRLAVRLTLDLAVFRYGDTRERFDLDWASFVLGPQLWLRMNAHTFFLLRAAAGGSFLLRDVRPPFGGIGPQVVSPSVDAALGLAFDLF
jgi:hypothetical protein